MMGKKKTAKMRGGGPVRRMSKGGGAINQHKRMAMGETVNMNSGGSAMYSRGYGVDEKSKRRPTELFTAKKGGAAFPRRTGGIGPGLGSGKKDDVPAMLMDGEFVMTRKAVKNAGNGSLNKGIKNMYSLMRNLEARRA